MILCHLPFNPAPGSGSHSSQIKAKATRKANEGVDDSQWKNAKPLERKEEENPYSLAAPKVRGALEEADALEKKSSPFPIVA